MKIIISDYARSQKIILTMYAIISLPVLPVMVFLYPFAKWITQDANDKEEVKLDLIELLSLSVAVSFFSSIVALLIWLC